MEVREFTPDCHHPIRAALLQENIAAFPQSNRKLSHRWTMLLAALSTTAAWGGLAYLVTWAMGGSVIFAWIAPALVVIFASALLGLSFTMPAVTGLSGEKTTTSTPIFDPFRFVSR